MTLRFAVLFALGLLAPVSFLAADDAQPTGQTAETDAAPPINEELAAEIAKEQKTAERFLTLLERNPREGTSLDKAYGFFVEQGELDELIASYRDRVAKDETDGAAWMILGLIEVRRGNDAQAIEALTKASEHRAEDPMAAYYLGRANAVAGRVDQAIAAFEQAIARKPVRADLPPIFSELGRLQQRSGQTEAAAAVWDRLETAFPNDLRVKAEIAAILDEEGQSELALARYDALAESADDEYRKVTYALKAAGLRAKLGKRNEAIADFEKLLAGLNPDNWLYREVRRGIEGVFLRTDDEDGLVAYYQAWIAKNAEDVAAMTRLAELLDGLGRADDARGWFDKAVKLAPSDTRLRRAYIDALRRGGKTAEAIAQFESLDKAYPNDPDLLRDWGTVYLEDKSLAEADRKAKAAAVWKRLPAARPNDPVVTAQVADWFRQAEMPEEALALYVKAAEQSPNDLRYLEYLGEYRHQLGKKGEAVATWRKLAEGQHRNARNLVRLAEVLSGFGYKQEAVAAFREADPLDLEFTDRIRFAELLRDEEQYDASTEQIAKAIPLAESDEERQNALTARIETDQAANRLEARIDELRKRAAEAPSAEVSLTLARYLDAIRDPAGATDAARDAVKRDPRSIAALATLARLADSAGQLTDAVEAFRRLAALDRRGRTEYLKQVAGLEQRLGKIDAALATAREVLASAPGSPDAYSFYADLCFRLGRTDDGLDALRRAARLASGDTGPTLALAAALAEQFRTDEAIELYWQAFDKSEAFDDKASVVTRLAELYLRTNRVADLIKRLERPEVGEDREAKLLVADAHLAAGDVGRATETLQAVLTENPRDTRLLGKLSQMAERDRDYETALRYQKEVVLLAPQDKAEKSRLAQLYLASDGADEGSAFWDSLVEEGLDPVETLSLTDALLGAEKYVDAERVIDRRLREAPRDWELLYRKAFALLKQKGKQDAADETFRRILELDLADESESIRLAAMRKKAASAQPAAQTNRINVASFPKIFQRTQSAYQAAAVLGIADEQLMGMAGRSASRRTLAWVPTDYGSVRIAAITWLANRPTGDAFKSEVKKAAEAPNASARALWDRYYLASIGQVAVRQAAGAQPGSGINPADHLAEQRDAAKQVAKLGTSDGAWVYLVQLASGRNSPPGTTLEPLPADELDVMLKCFETVRHESAGFYGTYIASLVARELSTANRKEDAKALVQEMLAKTSDSNELANVLQMAAASSDLETVDAVFDRYDALPPEKIAAASNSDSMTTRLMRTLWDEGKRNEAMRLFDRQLALSRRRLEVPKRAAAASSRTASRMMGRFGISYWKKGGEQDHVIVDGAELNAYIGMGEFTLLRNVYEFHSEEKAIDDFVAHLAKQADGQQGPKAAFAHLCVATVRGWQGNKEALLTATQAAIEAAPQDYTLRLTLARLLTERNRREEALALLDAVEPLNPNDLRDRELLVLDLAVRMSQIERAKAAANRLFGMRIDAEQQLQLANVMQQVGMSEQAEAVLARLRTQGGNSSGTQIELLRLYRAKGNTEVAVEIAREIIRKYKPSGNTSGRTADDSYREEAVRLLKETGQLDTLIADAKRQAERAPSSIDAQRQYADYLAAAGRAEDAVNVLKAISDKRPNDAGLKYDLAKRIAGMGRTGDAVDLYVAAINANPDLLSNNFYEIERTFEQANRSADMFRLIREVDLTRGNGLHYAINAISNKLYEDSTKKDGLDTLDALLKKYPDRRAEILPMIHSSEAWNDERISGALLDLVHSEGEKLTWNSLGNYTSISSGGQVRSLFNNVLSAAKARKADDELLASVTGLAEKHPEWKPGQAIAAVLKADRGHHDEARRMLRALLDEKTIPAQSCWSVGLEVNRHEPLRDLAIELVERACESNDRNFNDFQYTPQALLVKLYGDAGRSAEARTLLLTKALEVRDPGYSNPRDKAYFEIQNFVGVADTLREIGYPIDALRVYDNYAGDPARLQAAKGRGDYIFQQLEKGRQQAVAGIDAANAARFLSAAAAEEPTGDAPALDLVLTLNGTELSAMAVDSVIATALAKALAAPGTIPATGSTTDSPQAPPADPATQIRANLAALREKRPNDLSVHVVAGIAAFATGDLDEARAAAERAVTLAEENAKASPPPAGQETLLPPNVSLWLLAREAAKHEVTRPLAADLAEKALEAARASGDNRWAVAMLRERGQQALDAGDRDAAEKAWSSALDLIVPPSKQQAVEKPAGDAKAEPKTSALLPSSSLSLEIENAGLSTSVAVANRATDAITQETTLPAARRNTFLRSAPAAVIALAFFTQSAAAEPASPPVVTVGQAAQALQLAEIAARNGMTELSLRAVRQSLASGRPLNIVAADPNVTRVLSSSRSTDDVAQIEQQVLERLLRLDAAWRDHEADPAAVYETIADVVLCPGRPKEVFAYAGPLAEQGSVSAQEVETASGGKMLVTWASRAGRTDDLVRRLAERSNAGAAGVAVETLRVLASLEAGDVPAAKTALEALPAKVVAAPSPREAEFACHAALPGLAKPETADPAAAVITGVVARLAGSGNEQPLGWLSLRLADHEFSRGRPEEGEKRLAEYLAALNGIYSRYSGDYATYRRREVLQIVSRTLARHGRTAPALDRLGEALDLPANRYGGVSGLTGLFIPALVRGLADDDSAETYERLRNWTLPAGERKTVRLIAAVTAGDVPPAEFNLPVDPAETAFGPGAPVVTGTAAALIEHAKRSGKLAELTAEADRLAGEGIPGAADLSVLTHVAGGTGAEVADRFTKIVDDFIASPAVQVDFTGPTYPNLLLLAQAASIDPALRPAASRLLAKIDETSRGKGHAQFAAAQFLAARCAAFDAGLQADVLARDDFGPWRVGRLPRSQDRASARVPAVWAVRNGVARHVAGSEADPLVFRYPLTGSFDIRGEVFDGSYAEGHLGFGGLTYEQYAWSQKGGVFEIGRYGEGTKPLSGLRGNAYNAIHVEVRPGSTRCLVGNQELHVDNSPSAASPFLVLSGLFSRATWFRSLKIDGDPVIPREVRLIDGERLDGWYEGFFSEVKPARPGVDKPRDEEGLPTDLIWTVAGGVVTAKPRPETVQSLLVHHRPLWDGESVEYEFLHGNGNRVAHPALGRLAFLLDPEEVRLHWITGEGGTEWTGLPVDNVADAPQNRRGAGPLPFKENDWNAVKVSADAGQFRIELNGELIFERPLDPTDSRLFGFFRHADSPVQIRNVILRGDWPATLDDAAKADLLALAFPAADRDLIRFDRALITEAHYERPVWQRLNELAAAPPAERYGRLAEWVFPSLDNPGWRLDGAFSPADPAPVVTAYGTDPAVNVSGGNTGGRLVSAAGLLVATADELDRLDELSMTVEAAPMETDHDARCRLALQTMIAVRKGDASAAATGLQSLQPLLEKVPLQGTPLGERWPEVLAADAALDLPSLAAIALPLLDHLIVEQVQKDGRAFEMGWEKHARRLRSEAFMISEIGASRAQIPEAPPLTYWRSAPHDRSIDRGNGMPRPLWQLGSEGEIWHRGGPEWQHLYLTAPLRGDFEINAQLTSFGWREMQIYALGQAAQPRYDRTNFEVHRFGRERKVVPIDPPLTEIGDWYDYRVTVTGRKYAAYVNGRKIHEEELPEPLDPWVALAAYGTTNGGVRNLTITGAPTVPDELDLTAGTSLAGWRGYYPGWPTEDGRWGKQDGEIVAAKRASGDGNESVLFYHRPMFEDGEIEYEFLYKPETTLVHPTLDRLAFLLDPAGVRIHWLTDGVSERTGLAERNVYDEPDHRRGPEKLPLKPDDWNAVKLAVKGNTVTLTLNGETIYERPLEPENRRTFGFFHFADQTDVRIRKVRYRGDWPKHLPAADELFRISSN